MSVFKSYKYKIKTTDEERQSWLVNETRRIFHQDKVKQYENLFNQVKNNWQEQQILYIGKAKYECLMQMHDEILGIPLSGCERGHVVHFAQYIYLYSLQQFVRFIKTFTPNDEFYRAVSCLGCQEEIIDIESIGSLLKELKGLANLDSKYHFGNMDGFDSVLLEQLRRHYSYPNLGLGHAFDYSITQLNRFPREEETGITAAFDGAQSALK